MAKSGKKESAQDDEDEIVIDLPLSVLEEISQPGIFMLNDWNSTSQAEPLSAAAIGRADRFPCTHKSIYSADQPHLQLVVPDK